jgi:hypothetical protein
MRMKHIVLYSAKRYEGSSLIIIGGSSEEIHFTKYLLLQGEGRWHVITSMENEVVLLLLVTLNIPGLLFCSTK